MRRNAQLSLILFAFTCVTALALGEIVIRVFAPTEYLHPRYEFSEAYGLIPFPGVRMVHCVPGKFKFHYTVNQDRCRGDELPPPSNGDRDAIVILGDSYSFGMGVDDGENYASILAKELKGRYDVVNLSSPGWGLTQEIRRYFEKGEAYHPSEVVLEFCGNDPEDNFIFRVTTVENGEFVYHSSQLSLNWIKKFLSKSIVQRSQLYNFFRARAARAVQLRQVRKEETRYTPEDTSDVATPQERFYNTLLETFAHRLHDDGVRLTMISVDGQLDGFPHIRKTVDRLDAEGLLDYVEVRDWFKGLGRHLSKEGHWGVPAHTAIARGLAARFSAGK